MNPNTAIMDSFKIPHSPIGRSARTPPPKKKKVGKWMKLEKIIPNFG